MIINKIKYRYQTVFLYGLMLLAVSQAGCDYLPEIISGRPDPTAAKIQPVGPNASDAGSVPSPYKVPGKLVNEATSGYDDSVIQTGGSYDASLAVPPLVESPRNANVTTDVGLNVPPAESNPSTGNARDGFSNLSADGKIIIRNANLKFVNDLEIAAQADGLILDLVADEGDILAQGSLLVQLDDRLANSELQVTMKELEAAQEKAKDDSEIEYSRAAFDVAAIEYTKSEELLARDAETETDLRKKWLEKRRAELAITVAQLKNNQDKAAVEVSIAKRGAAEVQVDLRKMTVPFDGIVAEKKKEKYDWVRSGEVLLRLVSMERLRVVGQVRVDDLQAPPHQLMNAPVSIEIELFPGSRELVAGKIGFVSPVLEVSGAYRVWVEIPNKKVNDQWLFREGMPAKIEINTR